MRTSPSWKSWALAISLVFFGGGLHTGGCPGHPAPELHPSQATQADETQLASQASVEGVRG